jgi:hypothetical protein
MLEFNHSNRLHALTQRQGKKTDTAQVCISVPDPLLLTRFSCRQTTSAEARVQDYPRAYADVESGHEGMVAVDWTRIYHKRALSEMPTEINLRSQLIQVSQSLVVQEQGWHGSMHCSRSVLLQSLDDGRRWTSEASNAVRFASHFNAHLTHHPDNDLPLSTVIRNAKFQSCST